MKAAAPATARIFLRILPGVRHVLLLVCALFLFSPLCFVIAAQNGTVPLALYSISGEVRDAATLRPLAGVQLLLSWRQQLLPDSAIGPPLFRGPGLLRVETDARGLYRFDSLPPGTYELVAARVAYKNFSTPLVRLERGALDYSFDLEREPVPLRPVTVRDNRLPGGFRVPDSELADSLELRASLMRSVRSSYLDAATRDITSRDVMEAITLADPDIFRALQRTAGVGTRDDYTASIWTRGAPWDQTRIYFDDLPLYNPTHAGWLFSSINPDAIGSAYFMPGVRPAWLGEGAAGVLDLTSRQGGLDRTIQASADVSMVSARISADGKLPRSLGGWMLSMRRTYVDWFTAALKSLGTQTARIPYDFADVVSRFDFQLPLGMKLEASGIYERDQLRGDFPGILVRNEASWGNRAGRVTLVAPLPLNAELQLTAGGTRFGTRLVEYVDDEEPGEDPTLPSLSNGLSHSSYRLEVKSSDVNAGRARYSAGLELSTQRAEYDGPFSLTSEGIPGVSRDQVIRVPFNYKSDLSLRSGWVQALLEVNSQLRLDLGARVELGHDIANAGRTRLSPRVSGQFDIDSLLSVSAGFARSFQYAQDVGAAAGPLGPQLHLTHIWQLSRGGVPAMRSDIATIGAQRYMEGGYLFGVSIYDRISTGMTIPDPTPGEIRADRPLFVVARNNAFGAELWGRKVLGEWTGSASYSFTDSRLSTSEFNFPSPADVRHNVDVLISRRLTPALRVSGAFSLASGVPFTRFVIGESSLRVEEPYARRTPTNSSVDLSVEYSTQVGTRYLSAYLQLRNVLNRANRVTYSGSPERCSAEYVGGVCSGSLTVTDRFDAGIPLLPFAGVRFVF